MSVFKFFIISVFFLLEKAKPMEGSLLKRRKRK